MSGRANPELERNHARRHSAKLSHQVRHRLQLVIQVGVLALLILAPLPLGGDAPWAKPWLGVGLAVLWAAWVLWAYLRGEVRYWRSWSHVILLGVIGLTLCQLLPLGSLVQTLSPAAAARWEDARQIGIDIGKPSLSLVVGATRDGVGLALMALATFFIATNAFTSRRGLLLLAVALVAAATVNAVFGLADGLDGGQKTYWYLGAASWAVTGTFLNKNHFALLLEVGLSVATGIGLAVAFVRPRPFSLPDPVGEALKKHRAVFMLVLTLPVMTMVVGLLFSFSRAGLGCAIVALGALAACALQAGGKGKTWRFSLAFAGVILGFFLVGTQVMEHVWGRFEDVLAGENTSGLVRLDVWKGSLALLSDYWRCGVGFGAYGYASPFYESGVVPDRIAMHAHNDWLEFLCEFGVPFGLLLLAMMVAVLVATAVRLYRRHDPVVKWVGAGALVAVIAVAMHESFDYGLRKPGNLIVCMGALALATACSRISEESHGARSASALRTIRLGRISGFAFLVGGVGVAIAVVIAVLPQLLTGQALSRLEARVSAGAGATHIRLEDETRARIELATEVLRHLPDHPFALMQHAEAQALLGVLELRQMLAKILTRDLGYEVLPEDLDAPDLQTVLPAAFGKLDAAIVAQTAARFRRAVTDLRRACVEKPTKGDYLALYARAVERLGVFTGAVDESAVHDAFVLAHRVYPNVGHVTMLCAEGAWQRFLRLRLAVSESQAERLREEALHLFRYSLEQTPQDAERVYRTVWPVLPSLDVLCALTPEYIPCHEALYEFLLARSDFSRCLEQLDVIDRIEQATMKQRAAGSARTPWEILRQGRRPPEQVAMSVAKRRILLLGLLERWDERRNGLANLRANEAAELENQVQFAEKLIAHAEIERAQAHLVRVLAAGHALPRARVLLAKTFALTGQGDEATRVLLPFVYSDEPVDEQTLREALALVQAPSTAARRSSQEPPFPVWRFLRAGLTLKRGVAVQAGLPPGAGTVAGIASGMASPTLTVSRQQDCREALQELNLLVKMMEHKEVPVWIQTPMIHYLIGRAHEAEKEDTEALRAYARALVICPTHLPAAQAAARLRARNTLAPDKVLPPANGSEDEDLRQALDRAGKWLDTLCPTVPIDTDFGGKVRLLGYTVEPRKIASTGLVKVTFSWYCLADIEREYVIACRYSHDLQNGFADNYSVGDSGSSMVTWRVGEVVNVTRGVVPTRLLARQRRRAIAPGWYDVTIIPYAGGFKAHSLKPPVECRGMAFEVVANE